ncbi:MAG TPA: 30S ribosomal protein S2 [Acidimicrobiia bacterium]|nr:30S ribosomal protein S2 [Acidimicrobiia bacterium]
MKQLLEAGVHFGHQTRRWNPKMRPYIYGERNGIHIIDLRQTVDQTAAAAEYVRTLTSDGGVVLFVGTKKQAQAAVAEHATRSGMPYVNYRWLGGMLTNFQTIQKRIFYMRELRRLEASGEINALPKKERLKLRRELAKLEQNLGGVVDLQKTPDAVFIVDVNTEATAVTEAARLGMPVIALVDSNSDPDQVDYVIAGNDDAIRAADLIAGAIADAAIEGRRMAGAKASKGDAAGDEGSTSEAEDFEPTVDESIPDFEQEPAPATVASAEAAAKPEAENA